MTAPASAKYPAPKPDKFSAYHLAGEFVEILRTLIAYQKYKLTDAAKSAWWTTIFLQFPLNEKFSGISGQVPNYVEIVIIACTMR